MSGEIEVPAELTPAPDQVATAAPAPEVMTPEAVPADEGGEKPAKTFTQEELDEIIGKRLAREQRKWEREQAIRAATPQPAAPAVPPDPAQDPQAYAEALAVQKAEELLQQREYQRQLAEIENAFQERVEEAREKYDRYDEIVRNPNLAISDVMAETIRASEVGPDVAYYLGTNPDEARRIYNLRSAFLQAKEIGRIEAKIAAAPPVKKSTSAPAPINPVTARTSGNPSYDTTDPRSVKSMSTSEWIEAERQRQIRKWQAQQNR